MMQKLASEIVAGDWIKHMGIVVTVKFVRWFEDHPQGLGYFVIEYFDDTHKRIDHRTLTIYRGEVLQVL